MNYDLKIMALTIYGEARGASAAGKAGVAHVIMNRYARPGWWTRHWSDNVVDDTIAAACLDPYQFSCWNNGDPNLKAMAIVSEADPVYLQCMRMAIGVISGDVPDPTHGSYHYHTKAVTPGWSHGLDPVWVEGDHLFYNNVR